MGWPREPLSPAAHPPDTPLRLQRKTYRPITDCSRCVHFRRPSKGRRSRIQVLGDCRPSANVKHSLVQSIVAPSLILMLADTVSEKGCQGVRSMLGGALGRLFVDLDRIPEPERSSYENSLHRELLALAQRFQPL